MNQLVIKCTVNCKELFWFGFTPFHQGCLAFSSKGSQSLSLHVHHYPHLELRKQGGKRLLYRTVGIYRAADSSEAADDMNQDGKPLHGEVRREERGNCKKWKLWCSWKGRCSLPAREPKDICLPCLSTERGRRCGEPSRFLSRYTLSTRP